MDAGRKVAFGGDAELGDEHLLLPCVFEAFLPSIEADLTYGCRMSIEQLVQFLFPVWSAFVDEPRMIAEARQYLRVRLGQCSHGEPVSLAAAVDDHPLHFRAFGEQFRLPASEALGLQVVVGVIQMHLPIPCFC